MLILGPAFGRTDFSRIFIFEPPDFFADFLAGFFLLIFVGKSAQKNPPGKSPGKSSKIYTTKILQHISADCPGQLIGQMGVEGKVSCASFAFLQPMEESTTHPLWQWLTQLAPKLQQLVVQLQHVGQEVGVQEPLPLELLIQQLLDELQPPHLLRKPEDEEQL